MSLPSLPSWLGIGGQNDSRGASGGWRQGLGQAQITFFIGNEAAARAYSKAGFVLDGERRHADFEAATGRTRYLSLSEAAVSCWVAETEMRATDALGLESETVTIVPYDVRWARLFEEARSESGSCDGRIDPRRPSRRQHLLSWVMVLEARSGPSRLDLRSSAGSRTCTATGGARL